MSKFTNEVKAISTQDEFDTILDHLFKCAQEPEALKEEMKQMSEMSDLSFEQIKLCTNEFLKENTQ